MRFCPWRPSTVLCLILPLLLSSPSAWAKTYIVDGMAARAADSNPGTAAQPFKTIGKAAVIARAGDTVMVKKGTYREGITLDQSGTAAEPISFVSDGATITGADIISGWTRTPGDEPIYQVPWKHIFAIDYHDGKPIEHHPEDAPLWGRAEQLMVNGVQLLQSLDLDGLRAGWRDHAKLLRPGEPAPHVPPPLPHLGGPFKGMFAVDTTRQILYAWLTNGSSPARQTMEASTRGRIFGTDPWENKAGVSYIHVRGFHFRYGATFPQRAAVWLYGHDNVLEDSTVEQMAGSGVSVDGIMRRCTVSGCGQTGGAAGGKGFLNEDCSWIGNCWKPIDRGWDAGGVKLAESSDGAFRRCLFLHNGGPGLWFDIDCHNITVSDCRFEANEGSGLFIEISRDIRVLHNACLQNGIGVVGKAGDGDWSTGGIQLGESENCLVAFNTCIGNKDGITFREQGPRPIQTADAGTIPYHDYGDVVVENICAYNHGYQLGLWYDNGFFGWHPSEHKKYGTEAAYEAYLKTVPNRVYDPTREHLTIDRNLYVAAPGESLILYGVPWRPKFQEFNTLAAFTAHTGFDQHPWGIVGWELQILGIGS